MCDPDLQECKLIFLHLINQAVKDYEHFRNKTGEEDRFNFETAEGFLFDPAYTIQWGDLEVSLEDFCMVLDMDPNWFRNKITKKLDLEFQEHGVLTPTRRF